MARDAARRSSLGERTEERPGPRAARRAREVFNKMDRRHAI
jgi:hypothetical protein